MNQENVTMPLTGREKQVLQELATGKMYKEIADRYEISIDTVKKHCKNIYRKLPVRNRAEAAIYYHDSSKP
jgi:DNA-binding NarL/FixJ family response regulator